MIPHRSTRNRSMRLSKPIRHGDTIDQGGKLEVCPTNYKRPFSESYNAEIYHPLTRSVITQEIIAAFRI